MTTEQAAQVVDQMSELSEKVSTLSVMAQVGIWLAFVIISCIVAWWLLKKVIIAVINRFIKLPL